MSEADAVPQPSLFDAEAFPAEVLLIRHGQSAAVIPGSQDAGDPPLSDVGRAQAAALAERLKGKRLDAIWSSDYRRAADTAQAIAAACTLTPHTTPDLREVHLGDWEGGEFRRRAAVRDPEFLTFAASGRWENIPGAETDEALRARITQTVDRLIAEHPRGSVAVVAHGGLINAYLAETWNTPRSFLLPIENTSVTIVRAGANGLRLVVAANDCRHLDDPAYGPIGPT